MSTEIAVAPEQISETASEACSRVKGMGYSTGNQIHIYGEKFEMLSDPFPEGSGIAVRVKQLRDGKVRILPLPAMLWKRTTNR